jgi:glycine cleavage system transcriptional repressor
MNEQNEEYVISIICRDRIGLIYEISKAISDLNGNIADVRQSVLCGYFSMILLAAFPADVDQRSIERKFAEVDSRSDTVINTTVSKADVVTPGLALTTVTENAYVLTATGSDRVGLVATVSSFCADNQLNILDLSTTTSNGEYVMMMLVNFEDPSQIGKIRADLRLYAAENALNVVLQHHDIFKAINEISLPLA